MSSRWYPIYQLKGNPQLGIFIPQLWRKMVKTKYYCKPKPERNRLQFIVYHNAIHRMDARNYVTFPKNAKADLTGLSPTDKENKELESEQIKNGDVKHNKDKEQDESLKLQESISEAFIPFENQQRIIQDVIDEIWNPLAQQVDNVIYQPPAEFLQRGKTGVFDLSELLDLLRQENCIEVVTIAIPKEIDYADHMIIVTCRGAKHLMAVATYARKRFKMKKLKKTDVIPTIVSKSGSHGWIALDLGNIVLHLFLQQQRDNYDLEMLWSVGPMFDDLSNTKDPEIIQLLNMIK